jgi:hypothetical protein
MGAPINSTIRGKWHIERGGEVQHFERYLSYHAANSMMHIQMLISPDAANLKYSVSANWSTRKGSICNCAQSSVTWKTFNRKVFLWTKKERYATGSISSCGIVSPRNILPLFCYVTKDQSRSIFMEPMDLGIFVH